MVRFCQNGNAVINGVEVELEEVREKMPLRIGILFERTVVRRNDDLVKPQSGQIGIESGIRHDTDNDVRILFFNGTSKAENLQGKIMTKTGENTNALLNRVEIRNFVSFLVAYEKNFVPHSGKLIGQLNSHVFPATTGDSVKDNHYFHIHKSSKNKSLC
jgi:hypothetical protein